MNTFIQQRCSKCIKKWVQRVIYC